MLHRMTLHGILGQHFTALLARDAVVLWSWGYSWLKLAFFFFSFVLSNVSFHDVALHHFVAYVTLDKFRLLSVRRQRHRLSHVLCQFFVALQVSFDIVRRNELLAFVTLDLAPLRLALCAE